MLLNDTKISPVEHLEEERNYSRLPTRSMLEKIADVIKLLQLRRFFSKIYREKSYFELLAASRKQQ